MPFGRVLYKDIEHISVETGMDKAAIVPDPAGRAVFTDDTVLYIIDPFAAHWDLVIDTLFYILQVFRVYQAPKGSANILREFFFTAASEYIDQSLIHVD